jgi:1-acyl-sn-glycerol-3-phosphate acyltransferase
MNRRLKILLFALLIKPLVFIVLGLNIRGREKLPMQGPAIIAANHNSHLDTLVLMSLYPLNQLDKLRPVAAADYFLRNRFMAWLSLRCIGIIPFYRSGEVDKNELFKNCHAALDNGDILILFPEGSRGDPEKMSKIKKGLFYLVKDRSDTAITPVVMYGLGRALPRGEGLFVPFNCDVVIGDILPCFPTAHEFNRYLAGTFQFLLDSCLTRSSQSHHNSTDI